MREARTMPIPRPRREPIVVWVVSLRAANFKASRSEGSRLRGLRKVSEIASVGVGLSR